MSLYVQNLFPNATIWVAVLNYTTNCSAAGEPFEKAGWWSAGPNQTVEPIIGDLGDTNRYYAIYADVSNGDHTIGSPNLTYLVTNARFQQCSRDNADMNRAVDFTLIDVGDNDDFTVHIVPPGWKPPTPPPPQHSGSWPGDDDDDDDSDDDSDDDDG